MPCYITQCRAWTLGDVVAGVTVAVTSLPQYIAYAELAGFPGYRGVICSGPPIVVFAFLTGSPCLSVGVTSVTSLMAFAELRGPEYKEARGEDAWVDLMAAYSLLVGLASIGLAFSGAAKLAGQIPGSVVAGWKLGFALTVMAAQISGAVFGGGSKTVKALCGLPIFPLTGAPISGGAAATYRMGWTFLHPQLWDPATVAFSALTLFIVLRCKGVLQKLLRLPGVEVMIATVLGILLVVVLGYSGDVVGMPPVVPEKSSAGSDKGTIAFLTGWVHLWPWDMPLAEVTERLGGWFWALVSATAFACVDFLAIISIEAEKPPPGGWSFSRELAGQGVGCIASGMVGSAPIGGSLSRSMIAGMTGASSPLMGLVCGITTLILAFPQVGTLLAPTPKAVLAAICLAAVLPSVVRPKDVLKLKGTHSVVGWATALACVSFDPTRGFGVGCVLHIFFASFRRFLFRTDEKEGKKA